MQMILTNSATVVGLPPGPVREKIKARLTIVNPARIEAAKRGRYCAHLPRQLCFYEETPDSLTVPRGFAREAWRVLAAHGFRPEIIDNRLTLAPVDFVFRGRLRDYQQAAMDALAPYSDAVLQSPTGSGKTTFALAMIANRKQPALVVVHTSALLEQWADRIEQFLGIQAGLIGNGKGLVRDVTVTTAQSAKNRLGNLVGCFGMVVVDEAHRTPCSTFSQVASSFPAKYRLGVTATPQRRDAMTPALHYHLGPLVHRVDDGILVEQGAVLRPEIEIHETGFRYGYRDDFAAMVQTMIEDEPRNRLILDVIRKASKPVLCVSDRVEHIERLAAMCNGGHGRVAVMHGKTPTTERQSITANLEKGGVDVLFATSALIGEGYDAKGLCSLVLASPVRWSGKLIQLCGRVLRPSPGKVAVILDIVDPLQPILAHQAKTRMAVYRKEYGFDINNSNQE
ncbi:DEAD/DEAH box helicase [Desulfonatronum thiodismutans]|uniref:DEAD/DEAH box helicase n=1 Tax=Desulfonatronum thiodismutans TaxID=159290 RepID=UPI00069088FD|nr:DEAD/DEAH box helicase [Desulfonatronum thiodismutans]